MLIVLKWCLSTIIPKSGADITICYMQNSCLQRIPKSEKVEVQGGAPPTYKWIIIPLTMDISTINHSELGLMFTNLANELGHHLVDMKRQKSWATVLDFDMFIFGTVCEVSNTGGKGLIFQSSFDIPLLLWAPCSTTFRGLATIYVLIYGDYLYTP